MDKKRQAFNLPFKNVESRVTVNQYFDAKAFSISDM
jgi:hypothetical protein